MLVLWKRRQPVLAGRARLRVHRRRRGLRGHARVALAHRFGAGVARGHGVGHRRPPARPRRRDHAVDPGCAADRRLRGRDRDCDRGLARPEAGHGPTCRPSSTKSFASAAQTAEQYPQYSKQIIAAAKESFVDGQNWAYIAGLIAVTLGAVLVLFMFPKHDDEMQLLATYRAEDTAPASV